MQEFRRIVDTAMEDLDKLRTAKSVKEYESLYTAAKPNFQAVETKYNELSASLSGNDRRALESRAAQYDRLWADVRKSRKSLGEDPQPLEGGHKKSRRSRTKKRFTRKNSRR